MDIISYFKTKRPDLTLIPEQEELLTDLADVAKAHLILSCGRGFSKTMCSALAALYFADDYATQLGRPLEILLISHQQKIYDRIDEFFMKDDTLKPRLRVKGVHLEIPRDKFQFIDNLSIVTTCLATAKNIRGNRCDILIIDEAQDVPEHIYKVALGCLTGDICKVILIGTPRPSDLKYPNWFIDMVSDPAKFGYELKTWSSEVCWWNTKALEEWKKVYTKEEWAAEVLGRPPTHEEMSFFTKKHIVACTVHCEPTREGGPKSTIEIGIDFGYGSPNISCLTVTEKMFSKRKIIYEKTWKGFNAEEAARLIEGFPHALIKADSMPIEFKGKIEQYSPKLVIHYVDSHFNKDLMMSQLQKRIRGHELIIPDMFIPLIKELERYRKGKRAGDNRVDALALSCYEPATPFTTRVVAVVYE